MTTITNIASPGAPTQVVAQSTPTAPLDGGKPWGTPSQHPAAAGFANTAATQIVSLPDALIDRAGGQMNRR
jgi:hypothetical protein